MSDTATEKKPYPWWFVFIADGLSLLRASVFMVLVLLFSWNAAWGLAFTALAIGWLTDVVDGLAARKWGSLRMIKPKWDSDGLADTSLAFTSSLVPVIYYWDGMFTVNPVYFFPAIVLTAAWIASIYFGIRMVIAMGQDPDFKQKATKRLVMINMIFFHGLFQIGFVVVWMAAMAAGWLVVPTLLVLVIVGLKQQHKMQLWKAGRLTPQS